MQAVQNLSYPQANNSLLLDFYFKLTLCWRWNVSVEVKQESEGV